jgi:hypothetical protein
MERASLYIDFLAQPPTIKYNKWILDPLLSPRNNNKNTSIKAPQSWALLKIIKYTCSRV